eukprot:CAMPEP_0119129238 /NCGR_PEP_ID=MMETSP1310-20130426/7073_1 /TAXON_ID=464262 /ORGANISM="Genus nov. species nov., Strain RCC2339" /LENGTH=396 /DNA_ID=CAMNT_0007119655 /DNA_START=61 /DNA_END=1251 /DNA_ORIENTATION=-
MTKRPGQSVVLVAAVVVVVAAWSGIVNACTLVEIPFGDGVEFVTSRSLEFPGIFGLPVAHEWRLVSHPRSEGTTYNDALPGGIDHHRSNPYGFVSIDAVFRPNHESDRDILHILSGDGMNEFGLSVSPHSFATSQYQRIAPLKQNIFYLYFVPWALGNFKTADDLIASLRTNVSVVNPAHIGGVAKFHWSVSDATGASYVIEYLNGEVHAFDNTAVRVMTNDPSWPWHVQNLNTYASVSPNWSDGGTQLAVETPVGRVPSVVSNGYNLVGLPGDLTPQSRFVRTWYMKEILLHNRMNPLDRDQAIMTATALLNSVFIPKGSLASALEDEFNETKVREADFTQWNVCKLPVTGEYMFRSYENMQWKRVQLSNVDFSVGATPIMIDIFDGTLGIQDLV